MSILVAVHLLAALYWVGGMFFAHMVLRPAALELDAAARLSLWDRVFRRFLAWVWIAIAALVISGYWMIFTHWGGFATLPIYLHWMHGIGWLMFFIFLHLWFAPYRRFKAAMAAGDLDTAAACQIKIRRFVAINLVLGIINSALGASGLYF